MTNFKILKETLVKANYGLINSGLIVLPTDKQLSQLNSSSGVAGKEMEQVNSSTGLAVNFWRALELADTSIKEVEFEWKKQRPLKYGRYPANIDVLIKKDTEYTFVESKFLEPYYSFNETPRKSYLNRSKYSSYTKDDPSSWVALFEEAKKFKYYNVVQLCRHLLSISKDVWIHPKDYDGISLKLVSATWEITDSFLKKLKDKSDFAERRDLLKEKSESCTRLINNFIKSHLNDIDISFKCCSYNELSKKLKGSGYYNQFIKKYFL